jgi:hypothetical protein
LLTPKQQATNHKRAIICAFVRPEAPVWRVLFSMNYFDKMKPFSAARTNLRSTKNTGLAQLFFEIMLKQQPKSGNNAEKIVSLHSAL